MIGVSAAYTDSQGVGHDASSIGPGTFGPGNFVFPNNLDVQNNLAVQNSLNVTNSLRVATGNLFFPANARGIFWRTTSHDTNKPHIDYSDTTGLWISTGRTNTPINIEGGNLVIESGRGMTLGGVTKTEWPVASSLPASNITVGTFGSLVGGGNFAFPAAVTAPQIVSTGTITLGGVSKNKWSCLEGNCIVLNKTSEIVKNTDKVVSCPSDYPVLVSTEMWSKDAYSPDSWNNFINFKVKNRQLASITVECACSGDFCRRCFNGFFIMCCK